MPICWYNLHICCVCEFYSRLMTELHISAVLGQNPLNLQQCSLKFFGICSVGSVMSCGSSLSGRGQSVLLWSKCCCSYSTHKENPIHYPCFMSYCEYHISSSSLNYIFPLWWYCCKRMTFPHCQYHVWQGWGKICLLLPLTSKNSQWKHCSASAWLYIRYSIVDSNNCLRLIHHTGLFIKYEVVKNLGGELWQSKWRTHS